MALASGSQLLAAAVVVLASACVLLNVQAQVAVPYSVYDDKFPFCPPCVKNLTQYDVNIVERPAEVPVGSMCWRIGLLEACPDLTNECCTFFISKLEFWINAECPVTGWTAYTNKNGAFQLTSKAPDEADFNPMNLPTAGSNVLRIQGINITVAQATTGTTFCLTPPANSACQSFTTLCYRPTPEWVPGSCIISLFDPYRQEGRRDGHRCCPLLDDPPEAGLDALPPPPPPREPPVWSKCKCNASLTATPFQFQNFVQKTAGLVNPANNMYCFYSQFNPITAPYVERCPKARLVHKIEFLADFAKRNQLVAAHYRFDQVGPYETLGSDRIAWRDPNTGDNVLKLIQLDWHRTLWRDGTEVCLELEGSLELDDFCINEVNGEDYPVQCLYAIFDESKACCPQSWVGFGQTFDPMPGH